MSRQISRKHDQTDEWKSVKKSNFTKYCIEQRILKRLNGNCECGEALSKQVEAEMCQRHWGRPRSQRVTEAMLRPEVVEADLKVKSCRRNSQSKSHWGHAIHILKWRRSQRPCRRHRCHAIFSIQKSESKNQRINSSYWSYSWWRLQGHEEHVAFKVRPRIEPWKAGSWNRK